MLTTTHHMALVPRVTPDVHGSVLEGEMVLLNLTSGRYYTLNTVGAVVWGLCTGTSTLREIGEVICGQFEVSFELACEDIYTLVVELEAEGLVSIERR